MKKEEIKHELINVVNAFNKLGLYDFTYEEIDSEELLIDCCIPQNSALLFAFLENILINNTIFEIKDGRCIRVVIFGE